MDDLIKPDEQLEAKEFEQATKSGWRMPSKPNIKRSDLDWVINKWVIAVVAIIIVLIGGRWIHHILKTDDNKPAPVAVVNKPADKPKPQPATNVGPTAPPAVPTKPSGPAPAELPNTGPGSTVAIFLAVTVIAGSLHYVTTTRKS